MQIEQILICIHTEGGDLALDGDKLSSIFKQIEQSRSWSSAEVAGSDLQADGAEQILSRAEVAGPDLQAYVANLAL